MLWLVSILKTKVLPTGQSYREGSDQFALQCALQHMTSTPCSQEISIPTEESLLFLLQTESFGCEKHCKTGKRAFCGQLDWDSSWRAGWEIAVWGTGHLKWQLMIQIHHIPLQSQAQASVSLIQLGWHLVTFFFFLKSLSAVWQEICPSAH